jgi:hypothetical protein
VINIDAKVGQVISVTWFDSCTVNGWVYDEEFEAHPKVIESVGFVVAVSEDAVAISGGRSDSGGFISPISIPISCIRKYKIVEI